MSGRAIQKGRWAESQRDPMAPRYLGNLEDDYGLLYYACNTKVTPPAPRNQHEFQRRPGETPVYSSRYTPPEDPLPFTHRGFRHAFDPIREHRRAGFYPFRGGNPPREPVSTFQSQMYFEGSFNPRYRNYSGSVPVPP